MEIFTTGVITLFACAVIFYAVFFTFIYYWHLKKITFVVVPMIFAFEFFITGFFMISIVAIIIDYLPVLVKAAGI